MHAPPTTALGLCLSAVIGLAAERDSTLSDAAAVRRIEPSTAAAPYPPSPVITRLTWDESVYQRSLGRR